MYGNENGTKVFDIPVEWLVSEKLHIRASSLREAIEFIVNNADDIPLGLDPTYINGSWKISADETGTMDVDEIEENLAGELGYSGYTERDANEDDYVEELIRV